MIFKTIKETIKFQIKELPTFEDEFLKTIPENPKLFQFRL